MFKIAVSSHESQHIPVSNGAKNTSFITIFQALLLEKQHPLYSKAEPERRVNLLCEKWKNNTVRFITPASYTRS